MLWESWKKKIEKGHFCHQGRFEFVCIFMRCPDFTGGIPVVPSNFYPSQKISTFKGLFFWYKKKEEGFVDTVLKKIKCKFDKWVQDEWFTLVVAKSELGPRLNRGVGPVMFRWRKCETGLLLKFWAWITWNGWVELQMINLHDFCWFFFKFWAKIDQNNEFCWFLG